MRPIVLTAPQAKIAPISGISNTMHRITRSTSKNRSHPVLQRSGLSVAGPYSDGVAADQYESDRPYRCRSCGARHPAGCVAQCANRISGKTGRVAELQAGALKL